MKQGRDFKVIDRNKQIVIENLDELANKTPEHEEYEHKCYYHSISGR